MTIKWVSGPPTKTFIPKLIDWVTGRQLLLAKAVWLGAVERTPVKSGELRASWDISTGTPSFKVFGSPDSANTGGGGVVPKPTLPSVKRGGLGTTYYVTNGKNYAGFVEFGSPTTIPALMLTRAVQAVDL